MDLQRAYLRLSCPKHRNIMSESLYYKMEGKMDFMTHSSVNMKLLKRNLKL